VPVPPAVSEPLPKPGVRYLPTKLSPKAAAGLESAGSHGALDSAQVGLHVCLQGVGDGRGELHAIADPSSL
jgi:hypothetical protein